MGQNWKCFLTRLYRDSLTRASRALRSRPPEQHSVGPAAPRLWPPHQLEAAAVTSLTTVSCCSCEDFLTLRVFTGGSRVEDGPVETFGAFRSKWQVTIGSSLLSGPEVSSGKLCAKARKREEKNMQVRT
jgi:hypothetical protein